MRGWGFTSPRRSPSSGVWQNEPNPRSVVILRVLQNEAKDDPASQNDQSADLILNARFGISFKLCHQRPFAFVTNIEDVVSRRV